jgi:hypothetical protein
MKIDGLPSQPLSKGDIDALTEVDRLFATFSMYDVPHRDLGYLTGNVCLIFMTGDVQFLQFDLEDESWNLIRTIELDEDLDAVGPRLREEVGDLEAYAQRFDQYLRESAYASGLVDEDVGGPAP